MGRRHPEGQEQEQSLRRIHGLPERLGPAGPPPAGPHRSPHAGARRAAPEATPAHLRYPEEHGGPHRPRRRGRDRDSVAERRRDQLRPTRRLRVGRHPAWRLPGAGGPQHPDDRQRTLQSAHPPGSRPPEPRERLDGLGRRVLLPAAQGTWRGPRRAATGQDQRRWAGRYHLRDKRRQRTRPRPVLPPARDALDGRPLDLRVGRRLLGPRRLPARRGGRASNGVRPRGLAVDRRGRHHERGDQPAAGARRRAGVQDHHRLRGGLTADGAPVRGLQRDRRFLRLPARRCARGRHGTPRLVPLHQQRGPLDRRVAQGGRGQHGSVHQPLHDPGRGATHPPRSVRRSPAGRHPAYHAGGGLQKRGGNSPSGSHQQ